MVPLDLELCFLPLRLDGAQDGSSRPAFDVWYLDHTKASAVGMTASIRIPDDVPLGGQSGTLADARDRFAENAWSVPEALKANTAFPPLPKLLSSVPSGR